MTVNFYIEFDFPGDNGTVFMNKKKQLDDSSGMRLVNGYGTEPFDFDYVPRDLVLFNDYSKAEYVGQRIAGKAGFRVCMTFSN
jgi:hypothetical protein